MDFFLNLQSPNARMVELVDTLVSGTSVRKDVQVRVLFRVQLMSGSKIECGREINILKTLCF